MGRGLSIGFGAQPYTVQSAPGRFNVMGYDALLVTNAGLSGLGMTSLPGAFALTGGQLTQTIGGSFPAATPTFSPAAGTYGNAQRVTISCSSPGTASIYYTIDGSTPTTASTPYPGTINVPASCTLKATAIVAGFGQSAVGSAAYTITLGVPAGATALGYTQAQFNFAPQVSDIALNATQWAAGTFKFANKMYSDAGLGASASGYSMQQGVLALLNQGNNVYGSIGTMVSQMPNKTAGALPYLVSSAGWYVEWHEAIDVIVTNRDETLFLMPQEQGANGNLAYLELDVQEGAYQSGMFSTIISWKSANGLHENFSSFGTPAFDPTQYHRFGISYDPIGMKVTTYKDDVLNSVVSTNQTDTNGVFMDSSIKNFHYYLINYPQCLTSNNAYTQFISNIQAWIPPPAGVLAAPTGVQVLQQGQTTANSSTSSSTWFVPSAPNTMVIQFNTVTGATGYKVYRSTNGGTATLLPAGTVAAGAGTTQTFVDTTATNCAGLQPGPPPQFAAATSYAYYVSTVNASGEGAKSTQFSWYLYGTQAIGSGFPIAGTALYQELSYAASVTYGGSIGASGPCAVITAQQFGAWLVALGNTGCNWNLWSGAFNYLSFDIWVTAANTFNLTPHVRTVGGDTLDDLFNSSGGNFSYSFPVSLLNQWVTMKIALPTIRTDYRNNTAPNGAYAAGAPILQSSLYKMDFQPQSSPPVTFGIRNYVLTVT